MSETSEEQERRRHLSTVAEASRIWPISPLRHRIGPDLANRCRERKRKCGLAKEEFSSVIRLSDSCENIYGRTNSNRIVSYYLVAVSKLFQLLYPSLVWKRQTNKPHAQSKENAFSEAARAASHTHSNTTYTTLEIVGCTCVLLA